MIDDYLPAAHLACVIHEIEIYLMPEGSDHIYLHTNLPSALASRAGTAQLHITASRNTAQDYCERHWPRIVPHILDYRRKPVITPPHSPAALSHEGNIRVV